jgi:hypothetical protein
VQHEQDKSEAKLNKSLALQLHLEETPTQGFAVLDNAHLYDTAKHRQETSRDVYWESLMLVFDPRFQEPMSASADQDLLWYQHTRRRADIEQCWKHDKRYLPSTYAGSPSISVIVALRASCAVVAAVWCVLGFAFLGALLPYQVRTPVLSVSRKD